MTEADSFSAEPTRIKQIKKDRFSILIDGKAIFFRQRSFGSRFMCAFLRIWQEGKKPLNCCLDNSTFLWYNEYVCKQEGGESVRAYMNSLIGNESLRRRLCADAESGQLHHAYIVEGPSGSGKHTLSRQLAAAVSCERRHEASAPLPCLACPTCRKIMEGLSPDVIMVKEEEKASMGVDTVRFLKQDVYIIPNELDTKIYIIEDADRMTPQAQNAFLLTLEEPPSYAVFLLLCENAGALLETVRSRAPILKTERLSKEQIDGFLCAHDRRAVSMKQSSPRDYAELLLCADGSIGTALEMLEPNRLSPILEKKQIIKRLVANVAHRSGAPQIISLMAELSQKREPLSQELSLLTAAVRDLILLKKSETAPLCFYTDRDEALTLSDEATLKELWRLLEAADTAIQALSHNANVRLTVLALLSDAHIL